METKDTLLVEMVTKLQKKLVGVNPTHGIKHEGLVDIKSQVKDIFEYVTGEDVPVQNHVIDQDALKVNFPGGITKNTSDVESVGRTMLDMNGPGTEGVLDKV